MPGDPSQTTPFWHFVQAIEQYGHAKVEREAVAEEERTDDQDPPGEVRDDDDDDDDADQIDFDDLDDMDEPSLGGGGSHTEQPAQIFAGDAAGEGVNPSPEPAAAAEDPFPRSSAGVAETRAEMEPATGGPGFGAGRTTRLSVAHEAFLADGIDRFYLIAGDDDELRLSGREILEGVVAVARQMLDFGRCTLPEGTQLTMDDINRAIAETMRVCDSVRSTAARDHQPSLKLTSPALVEPRMVTDF